MTGKQSSSGADRCDWCGDAPGDAISGVAICDDCLDRYEIPPRMISGQMDAPVKITDGGTVEDGTERLPMLPWCRDCWDQAAEGAKRDRDKLPEDCQHCGSSKVFWI